MHDDSQFIDAGEKAIIEEDSKSNEHGLSEDVTDDAKTQVANLKEMHRKLETLTDEKEKAALKTRIMLKVHSLEQLLQKQGVTHKQKPAEVRRSNTEQKTRSSGILTKSEFDYDQNGIIIESSVTTEKVSTMQTFEPLVSFENTTKSPETVSLKEFKIVQFLFYIVTILFTLDVLFRSQITMFIKV